jgi:hypothetical protein
MTTARSQNVNRLLRPFSTKTVPSAPGNDRTSHQLASNNDSRKYTVLFPPFYFFSSFEVGSFRLIFFSR